MSDYAYMPFSDYEDACDATREKTGNTEPIKSGDLAAEIRSIQTGGGGGAVASANILNGVGLNAGYLDANGNPAAQDSTRKEVYTDEIDVSNLLGETIALYVVTSENKQHWDGYVLYDENHTRVGNRVNIVPNANVCCSGFTFTLPSSGVKYIRMSWRTYGNARYAASVGDAVYNAIGEDGFSVYPEVSNNA